MLFCIIIIFLATIRPLQTHPGSFYWAAKISWSKQRRTGAQVNLYIHSSTATPSVYSTYCYIYMPLSHWHLYKLPVFFCFLWCYVDKVVKSILHVDFTCIISRDLQIILCTLHRFWELSLYRQLSCIFHILFHHTFYLSLSFTGFNSSSASVILRQPICD